MFGGFEVRSALQLEVGRMAVGDFWFDIRFECEALGVEDFEILSVEGCDAISQLFHFTITALTNDPASIDDEALLHQPASLVIVRNDGTEHFRFFGMVETFRDTGTMRSNRFTIELEFVPRVYRSTLFETLDVVLDKSIAEIIEERLADEKRGALTKKEKDAKGDFTIESIAGQFPPREFTVQYRESDMSFLARLCESWGIHFHIWHDQRHACDVVVFADNNGAFKKVLGPRDDFFDTLLESAASFDEDDGLTVTYQCGQLGQPYSVFELEKRTRKLPKTYVARDYNYRTPDLDLLAAATVDENGVGEIIEYAPHAKDASHLQYIANIRAEELRTTRAVYHGRSTIPSLYAGGTLTILGHPRGDLELLITKVEHQFVATGASDKPTRTFTNRFEGIPVSTTYRAPRTTPKPVVKGFITGTINPSATSSYAELDDDGRYNVRFHFDTDYDRDPKTDGRASHKVRMAQPHAGEGYGMHFPLRGNVEVMMMCQDGDPERPVIAGCLPNPATASPVTASNSAHNVIQTGGGNRIDFDDTEGSTRIKINVPHAETVFQLGAPNEAEEGGYLGTAGHFVENVAGTAGHISSIEKFLCDDHTVAGTGHITMWAGGYPWPRWFKHLHEGIEVIAKAMIVVNNTVELATHSAAHDVKEQAAAAEKALKEARASGDETAAARAEQQLEDAAHTTELLKSITGGCEDTEKIAEGLAGGAELWSDGLAHLNDVVVNKALGLALLKWVEMNQSIVASKGRRPWRLPPPAIEQTTSIMSNTSTFMWSKSTTLISSGGHLSMAGDRLTTLASHDDVQVKSGNDMEIAAGGDLYETVNNKKKQLVRKDVESQIDGKLSAMVKKDTELDFKEGKLDILVETGDLILEVKKGNAKETYAADVTERIKKNRTTTIDKRWDVTAKMLSIKGDDFGAIDYPTLKCHGRKEAFIRTDDGGLDGTSSRTQVYHGSSHVRVESSAITAKTSSFTADASTSRIKGKVILG